MPKRKRSGELSLQEKLEKHREDIFRALKTAKGFERQRLSKRLRDDGVTPDKKERLEREVAVLKSLDLHQTARAHLYSSLLKVKSIAASTDLPDEIRTGVPKPELDEDEKAALHNVTSGLYNREPVKQSVDRAIAAVCEKLNVPLPEKGKRSRKNKREEEQAEDRKSTEKEKVVLKTVEQAEELDEEEEESEFEGFESDVDEPGPPVGELDSEAEAEEENEFSKYDHLLGSSSSDEDDEEDEERFERFKGRGKVNLDDISISGSDADPSSGSEAEPESEAEQSASSPSPPSAKKTKKPKKEPSRPDGSTFLPTLMGGYISGSESASDIDVAPAKKRRGQRARQAIWEKKFGSKAKHVQEQARGGGGRGRDAGWDMRRGAVGADDQRTTATPWKKGVSNPLLRQKNFTGATSSNSIELKKKPPKKDDEGPLHPSWEARKKAKEAQKTVAFSGAKITFD